MSLDGNGMFIKFEENDITYCTYITICILHLILEFCTLYLATEMDFI